MQLQRKLRLLKRLGRALHRQQDTIAYKLSPTERYRITFWAVAWERALKGGDT